MANLPLSSFPSSPPLLFLLSTGRPFALPRGTRIHIHIHVCTCAGTNTSPPTEMAVELCRVVAEVVAHAPTPGPSNSTTSNIAIPSSSRRLLLAATFHLLFDYITFTRTTIYIHTMYKPRGIPPFFPEHAHPLAHAHAHPLRSDASHRSKSNDPRVHHARGSTISRNLKRNGKPFFFPPISFEISSPTSMHIYIYIFIN